MTFTETRAIVTGGASGIGLATANWLADRGASVAVLDREQTPAAGLTSFLVDLRDDQAVP